MPKQPKVEATIKFPLRRPMTYRALRTKDGRVVIKVNRFFAFDLTIEICDQYSAEQLCEALNNAQRLLKGSK